MNDRVVFSGMALLTRLLNIGCLALLGCLIVLAVRALRKYCGQKSGDAPEKPQPSSLGEALKARRTEMGMTQEYVAEQLGVSRQAVAKWERGQSVPGMANLTAIAGLLKIPAEELLRIMSGREARKP